MTGVVIVLQLEFCVQLYVYFTIATFFGGSKQLPFSSFTKIG